MNENYQMIQSEFDRKASTYDEHHTEKNTTMALHERIRRNHVKEMLQNYGKLLSIGCGTCWCLKYFSYNGYQSFGVDISRGMLMQCKGEDLNVCLANAENLPFINQIFDNVLCTNTFQYLEDPSSLFSEVNRVMKSEAIFVFDFKNCLSLRSAAHCFVNWFRKNKITDNEKRYTLFRIRKLLQQAHLEIDKMIGMEFDFFQTDRKLRSKRLIKIMETVDYLLANTPLKYFSGRLMVTVVKK